MPYIIIIISFVLDSIVSNFISLNSLFMPLCTLMSLIIAYPYFKGDLKKYLITCFVTGICYDLIYTDTIVIHGFLFLVIGLLITRLNLFMSNNWFNVTIMAIICIIFYRIISYGLLLITANIPFSYVLLLKSIYQSLLLNIIYIALAFIITDKISFKLKIRKSD